MPPHAWLQQKWPADSALIGNGLNDLCEWILLLASVPLSLLPLLPWRLASPLTAGHSILQTLWAKRCLHKFSEHRRCRRFASTQQLSERHQILNVFSSTCFIICPSTQALEVSNAEMHCAVHRRLGMAVMIDGPDLCRHRRLADGIGGRTIAGLKAMIAVRKEAFGEAMASIPECRPFIMWSGCCVIPTSRWTPDAIADSM